MTGTTVILIMAANTSYNGFPRLGALLAIDGFLPRQLSFQGSRLVYSRGIVVLALLACGFIVVFDASVTRLIPLYAIGVFLSFSLSQAGMSRQVVEIRPPARGTDAHGTGLDAALRSGLANQDGRQCPGRRGHRHGDGDLRGYEVLAGRVDGPHPHARARPGLLPHPPPLPAPGARLTLEGFDPSPPPQRHRVILPISGVHQGTMAGLRYAQLLSSDITAVHVSIDPVQAERVEQRWETWGEGVRLVVLESPYRLMHEPLLRYIGQLALSASQTRSSRSLSRSSYQSDGLTTCCTRRQPLSCGSRSLFIPGVIVTDVPYQVD